MYLQSQLVALKPRKIPHASFTCSVMRAQKSWLYNYSGGRYSEERYLHTPQGRGSVGCSTWCILDMTRDHPIAQAFLTPAQSFPS